MSEKRPPCRGELDAVTAPCAQIGFEMLLEPLQRGAHARLLSIQGARRRADAAAADDLVEHEE